MRPFTWRSGNLSGGSKIYTLNCLHSVKIKSRAVLGSFSYRVKQKYEMGLKIFVLFIYLFCGGLKCSLTCREQRVGKRQLLVQ